jgi:hypothetical protein
VDPSPKNFLSAMNTQIIKIYSTKKINETNFILIINFNSSLRLFTIFPRFFFLSFSFFGLRRSQVCRKLFSFHLHFVLFFLVLHQGQIFLIKNYGKSFSCSVAFPLDWAIFDGQEKTRLKFKSSPI